MQTDFKPLRLPRLRPQDLRVLDEIRQHQPDAYAPTIMKAVLPSLKGPRVLRAMVVAHSLLRLEQNGLVSVTPENRQQRARRTQQSIWQRQQRMFYVLTPKGEDLAKTRQN
jgi:hypothetical protein